MYLYLRQIKSVTLVQEAVYKMKHPGPSGDDWFPWFLFPFPLLHPCSALSLSQRKRGQHLKTIREARCKLCLAGAQLMLLQYNGEGLHICGVLAGRFTLGYILVTAGLPFWSSPHFSEDHLSNHHGAKFHMCVLTCVTLCRVVVDQQVLSAT